MQHRKDEKIKKLMLELLSIYVEDHKPITVDYQCLGMHYKLTFNAEDLEKSK